VSVVAALRRLPPLETAVLILAVALLVGLGFAGRRQSESSPQVDSFSTYDAASGGYRAFYELLAREGVRVERFRTPLSFLDASVDTLVYVEPDPSNSHQIVPAKGEIAALEAWVRGGGRLLYIGMDDEAARRGILHLPESTPAAHRRRPGAVAGDFAVLNGVARLSPLTDLRWKRSPAALRARTLVDDGRGPLALTYSLGLGRVAAVIDERIFENGKIAEGDRARLAYALARPGRAGGVVSFDEMVHGYTISSRWWNLVPRGFAVALCLALVTILVAVAGAAVRFGPPLALPDARDRSSADFIVAFASLLERGRAARSALADAFASTARAVLRSLGLAEGTPAAQIASHIERADLREDFRSLAALTERDDLGPAEFVRGVALASRLRKEFAAHGRPRY
jgi:hypothetical protein